MFNDGIITIYSLENLRENALMPELKLVPKAAAFFDLRSISYSRQYMAQGINSQVDQLARTLYMPEAMIGDYRTLNKEPLQYRITNISHLRDNDGIRVTDITLTRLNDDFQVQEADVDDYDNL